MTATPNAASVRDAVLRVLGRIAPEAELSALDARADLREQLDIDSMDFLRFAIGLHEELGIDVPEADYPRLRTMESCVDYLSERRAEQPG